MKSIVSAFILSFAFFSYAYAQVAGPALDPGFLILATSVNPAVLQWHSTSIITVGKFDGTNKIFDQNGQPVFRAEWEGEYSKVRYVDEDFAIGADYFSGNAGTNIPSEPRDLEKGFGLATKIREFLAVGFGAFKTDHPSTPVETRRPTFGISLRFFEELYFGYSTGVEIRRSDISEIARNNRYFGVGYLTKSESFKIHAEIWRAEMPAYRFVSGFVFGEEDITAGIIEFNFNGFQFGLRVAKFVGFDESFPSRRREEDTIGIQVGWVPHEGFAAAARFETSDRTETPSGQTREIERLYLTLAYIF